MLTSMGSIGGTLLAGAMAEVMPERHVMLLMGVLGVTTVYLFMYRGREHVAAIYNRDL